MKLSNVVFVSIATTAAALLSFTTGAQAAPQSSPPLNYDGKAIYLRAVSEIVDGYNESCMLTLPAYSRFRIHKFVETADCHSIKNADSGNTSIQAIVSYTKTTATLHALKLRIETAEVLKNSEEMIGESVLTRVLGAVEENYGLTCKQGHDSIALCSIGEESACLYQMRFNCGDNPAARFSSNGMKINIWVETGVDGAKAQIHKIVFHPYGSLKK